MKTSCIKVMGKTVSVSWWERRFIKDESGKVLQKRRYVCQPAKGDRLSAGWSYADAIGTAYNPTSESKATFAEARQFVKTLHYLRETVTPSG